jgi:transcriptional antiterminator NusG
MKVKMTIEKRAETMGLRQKLFRILVPTDTETRNRGGKKTEYKRKVFPGYVLIDMVLDDDTWYLIKSTTGVTGFVSSGNKPVPLQDKEVRDILDALDPNNAASRPKKIWEKNQVVRVNSGPFADFTGKIEEVNDTKEKVKVMISLFGRDTPVELDFNQIEKI